MTVLAGICCPAEGQIKNVTLGWQGQCKLGYWTPAQFEYEGELPADFAVEFTLPDTDGVPVAFVDRSPRVEMRSGRKWIQTVVKLGRSRGQVLVRLLSEKNDAMSKEIASSQSRLESVCTPVDSLVEMFVSVGRSIEMNSGVAIGGNVDYASPIAVLMENADFLPETSIAYESINGLVLEISGLFEKPLPKGVQVALRDWVFKGGRLAITGGENLAGFFAAHPVLASIQSVKFSAAKPLDSTDTLERVLKADSRIPDDRGRLVVAVVDEFEGDVLLEEDSRSIVIRKNVAFGVVVLVTVNLADDPLASWSDRKKLTGQVVSILVDSGNARNRSELRGGRAGYQDLSGQLRTALDHFSGVSAVNFTVVAAIAILFICLIGPADYFFLKKIVKRMEWTWVSFLALVLLACGSIYLIHKSTKPDSLACRQVEIVDIDVATNRARGTVWAHLYSPASKKYDIDWVTGETIQRDQRSGSWFGFPGTALGGMDNQSTNTSQSSRYSIDLESRAVQAMPVNVAATKGLQLDWSGKPVSEFKQELKANRSRILGRVQNPLDVELENVFVVYDRSVFVYPSKLKPGDSFDIDDDTTQKGVLDYLNRRKLKDLGTEATPWSNSDTDLRRILEIMMFYEKAGGRGYVNLYQRYQFQVDLSHLVDPRHAILVGRTRKPFHRMTVDGKSLEQEYDESWTYYRIIIPVKSSSPSLP